MLSTNIIEFTPSLKLGLKSNLVVFMKALHYAQVYESRKRVRASCLILTLC